MHFHPNPKGVGKKVGNEEPIPPASNGAAGERDVGEGDNNKENEELKGKIKKLETKLEDKEEGKIQEKMKAKQAARDLAKLIEEMEEVKK